LANTNKTILIGGQKQQSNAFPSSSLEDIIKVLGLEGWKSSTIASYLLMLASVPVPKYGVGITLADFELDLKNREGSVNSEPCYYVAFALHGEYLCRMDNLPAFYDDEDESD